MKFPDHDVSIMIMAPYTMTYKRGKRKTPWKNAPLEPLYMRSHPVYFEKHDEKRKNKKVQRKKIKTPVFVCLNLVTQNKQNARYKAKKKENEQRCDEN